jgi:zinc transporter 7
MSLLKSRGGVASLSVLAHELPHELGDFSILVSNGMSKSQAIMAQFSTAIAAFVGTIVGLMASAFDDTLGHEVLLPFVSGGFVYLAACSILPELLEERNVGFILRSAQVLAFGAGIGFMQLVAVLEDMEGDHHHHHHHHHDHGDHHHGKVHENEL